MIGELTVNIDATLNVRIVDTSKPTLEEYLREGMAAGVIDFRLRASYAIDGRLKFYLHPLGVSGKTQDFEVSGDIAATLFESGTFR